MIFTLFLVLCGSVLPIFSLMPTGVYRLKFFEVSILGNSLKSKPSITFAYMFVKFLSQIEV